MSEDLDFSEPWPLYSEETKPWTDYERLLRLDEQMDTQAEIADALGCTPSTISNHLQQARDDVTVTAGDDEQECVYHSVCGQTTVGPHNEVCALCLDLVRYNERHDGPEPDGSLEEHIRELYDEHSEKVAEWRQERQYNEPDDDGEESEAKDSNSGFDFLEA